MWFVLLEKNEYIIFFEYRCQKITVTTKNLPKPIKWTVK